MKTILPESIPTIEAPRWLDGEPENLSAAAEDAFQWLEFLRKLITDGGLKVNHAEAGSKLSRCIIALRRFLDNTEANHYDELSD